MEYSGPKLRKGSSYRTGGIPNGTSKRRGTSHEIPKDKGAKVPAGRGGERDSLNGDWTDLRMPGLIME